jgi:hypothetical protein
MSVSRNKISSISWNVFSALNYSFIEMYNDLRQKYDLHIPPILLTLRGISVESLLQKDFDSDPLISAPNFWVKEEIISVVSG